MSRDYHDFTSLDAEAEGGRPVPKVPVRLPPKSSWTPRLCPSRRLVLILLGLTGILSLMVIVFSAKGSNFSSQLWGLKEVFKSINGTVVGQMDTLQKKEAAIGSKIAQVERAVQKLTKEGETVRRRLQGQVKDIQRNLRTFGCDLDNFKNNKTASTEPCCPKDWVSFRKNCYWESRVGKSWEEAKEDCEARNAHLVIINSYEEQLFVAVRVKPLNTWIGLTDASGSWKWVDGSSYTVHTQDWCPEQPDDWYWNELGGGEDCAHLAYTGCWNDEHCSRQFGWVCEMEIQD